MTIGETLRKAREAHGLSIEDVKNATLMLTRQIEELENDDFSSFAAPVYGKGFIRLYARTVGLDPDPLVAEYLSRASGRPDPSRDQPFVPLETIAEEGGAIQIVRPEPHPAPAHSPAPQPKPAPDPAPAPQPASEATDTPADASAPADDLFAAAAAAAAAPKPATVPGPQKSAPFEKRAAPLPTPDRKSPEPHESFEKRAAPLPAAPAKTASADEPSPEKRIAPVEPGVPPPAPPAFDRGERRNEVRIEFSDRPVVKRLVEEENDDAPRAALSDHPVAPAAVPLSVPPFVFPDLPVADEPDADGEPLLRDEPVHAKPAAPPRATEDEEVEKTEEERPAGPFRMRLRGLGSAARDRLASLRARFSKKPVDEGAEETAAAAGKDSAQAPRRSRPVLLDADPDEAPAPSKSGAQWRRPAWIGGAAAAVLLVLALLFSRCSGSPKAPNPADAAAQTNAPAATVPAAPQAAPAAAPAAPDDGEDWSIPRRILDPPRSFAR